VIVQASLTAGSFFIPANLDPANLTLTVSPRTFHPNRAGETAMGNLAAEVIGHLLSTSPPQDAGPTPVFGSPAVDQLPGAVGTWEGFGQVRPATVHFGGDPTSLVSTITWQSWGGSEATGTGVSDFVGPNTATLDGKLEQVTIVASDLGNCPDGTYGYRKANWYFPEEGQQLGPAIAYDTCTGNNTTPPTSTTTTPSGGDWNSPNLTITTDSLGPVTVGMTLQQAEGAAGLTFDGSGDGMYYPTSLPIHLYVGLGSDGTAFCVGASNQASGGSGVTVTTPSGFTFGESVQQLLSVYGSRATYVPAPSGGLSSSPGYVVTTSSGSLAFAVDPSTNTVYDIVGGPNVTPNSCPG
jgi:hypothetical protein